MTDAPFIDYTRITPNDWRARTTPLSRLRGDQIYMIAHHAYALTIGQIIATFESPNRTVTANLAIGPTVAGRDAYVCAETVPIDGGRAYTTASSYDNVALTFEMANLSLAPPYRVGQTGKQIAAEVAAWLHTEYGMPLDRWHVTCHREVYERGWGSYATACPGDDLHDALDWIVAEAKRIVAGGGGTGGGTEVIAYEHRDNFIGKPSRTLKAGEGFYLHETIDNRSNASNIIGGVGEYSITGHVYAEGTPGDVIELLTVWQVNGVNSNHYPERITIDRDGQIKSSVEWKRDARPGDKTAVFLRVSADADNVGDVKITHLASDAFQYTA